MRDALRPPNGLCLPEYAWEAVARAYEEPHRRYHGLSHLIELDSWFHRIANEQGWTDPIATYLALLYHDVVYEVGRTDNEERSAALLLQHAPEGDLARAARIILATARHGALDPAEVDRDTALFLDSDLAILGASPEHFDAYDRGVAAEYRTVLSQAAYRAGRRAFLTRLLDRPRLFLTDWFHERLDGPARDNLRRALAATAPDSGSC